MRFSGNKIDPEGICGGSCILLTDRRFAKNAKHFYKSPIERGSKGNQFPLALYPAFHPGYGLLELLLALGLLGLLAATALPVLTLALQAYRDIPRQAAALEDYEWLRARLEADVEKAGQLEVFLNVWEPGASKGVLPILCCTLKPEGKELPECIHYVVAWGPWGQVPGGPALEGWGIYRQKLLKGIPINSVREQDLVLTEIEELNVKWEPSQSIGARRRPLLRLCLKLEGKPYAFLVPAPK